MKIKTLNNIAAVGLERLPENYEIVDDLETADAVLVRSASMHEMELPKQLLAIGRAGAGVNNIPLDKCAEQGIVVFNAPGANANAVKELVIAGLLLASRDIIGGVNWVHTIKDDPGIGKLVEKGKKQFAGCEIMGKKLGVIGLGAIGVNVANACVNLGMDVYGYDPYLSVKSAWNLSKNVHPVSDVNDIYRECDYITVHVPLMDSTRHMINAEALEKMKDGVIVLNIARDPLVDDDALAQALKSGKVKKYVTDFPDINTAGMEGVIAIPHLGASTAEAEENCAIMAVNEIVDYIENGNITHSVNFPDCDLGVCQAQSRVAVCHKNVPQMISKIVSCVGGNIDNMTNKSKGDWAYTMFDVNDAISDEVLARLRAIEDVVRVRKVK